MCFCANCITTGRTVNHIKSCSHSQFNRLCGVRSVTRTRVPVRVLDHLFAFTIWNMNDRRRRVLLDCMSGEKRHSNRLYVCPLASTICRRRKQSNRTNIIYVNNPCNGTTAFTMKAKKYPERSFCKLSSKEMNGAVIHATVEKDVATYNVDCFNAVRLACILLSKITIRRPRIIPGDDSRRTMRISWFIIFLIVAATVVNNVFVTAVGMNLIIVII